MVFMPENVVELLLEKARDSSEISRLAQDISYARDRMDDSEAMLSDVKSAISTWDRINVFSKTTDEIQEEELAEDIQELSRNLEQMNSRLDYLLMDITRRACSKDLSVLRFVAWSIACKFKDWAIALSIDYGYLGALDFIDHSDDTIVGKEECVKTARVLEHLTKENDQEPVAFDALLSVVKKKLIKSF